MAGRYTSVPLRSPGRPESREFKKDLRSGDLEHPLTGWLPVVPVPLTFSNAQERNTHASCEAKLLFSLHMASQAGDGERKKRRLIGTVLWFRKISMIDVLRSLNTVVRNYRLFERRRVCIHSLNASHPSRTRVAAAAVDGDDDP